MSTESGLYRQLGALTKNKDRWKSNITYVSSLLTTESTKNRAKALWLLGEMGYKYPSSIVDSVPAIATFCKSRESILRERAITALGRIGRSNYDSIEPYWKDLFQYSTDQEANVRLSFIWASENIATNMPDLYEKFMIVFAELLHDVNNRVRMEAPEMFRVIGKRRPEYVKPYVELLREIAETDRNYVVRVHCLGAINAVI